MTMGEIGIGTILTKTEDGGEYRVVRIEGEEIELEHMRLEAQIVVFLWDLPVLFVGVRA